MLPVISVGISENPNTASFSSKAKSMHTIADETIKNINKGMLQLPIKSYIWSSKKLKIHAQSIISKMNDMKPKPLLFNFILRIKSKRAAKNTIKIIIKIYPLKI